MADTGTVVVTFKPKIGSIQRIDFDWISDGSGDAELLIGSKLSGELIALITDPGSAAPTASYDITILDDKSIDILNGKGIDRNTTTTEQESIFLDGGTAEVGFFRPVSTDNFTFIVANAGDTKAGLAQLYLK